MRHHTIDADTDTPRPDARGANQNLAALAERLRIALERVHDDVKALLAAVEAEAESLENLDDPRFADAQAQKERALEGLVKGRAEAAGVLSELETMLGCEAGMLKVASLSRFAPEGDWRYVQALSESISATLEAAQKKSRAASAMVRARLSYFDFLSSLILRTWEKEMGGSAAAGDSISLIVDERA
jgi:hypothetical protein